MSTSSTAAEISQVLVNPKRSKLIFDFPSRKGSTFMEVELKFRQIQLLHFMPRVSQDSSTIGLSCALGANRKATTDIQFVDILALKTYKFFGGVLDDELKTSRKYLNGKSHELQEERGGGGGVA